MPTTNGESSRTDTNRPHHVAGSPFTPALPLLPPSLPLTIQLSQEYENVLAASGEAVAHCPTRVPLLNQTSVRKLPKMLRCRLNIHAKRITKLLKRTLGVFVEIRKHFNPSVVCKPLHNPFRPPIVKRFCFAICLILCHPHHPTTTILHSQECRIVVGSGMAGGWIYFFFRA